MTPERRPAADAGFTLIELLIAAALMSLLAVLVATTTVGGLRTAARGEKRVDDVAQAQRAMLQMSADIRASQCFLEATPQRLRLFTRTSGDQNSTALALPDLVTYEVTAGHVLQRTRQPATAGTTCSTWSSSVTPVTTDLVGNVLLPDAAGRAVFTMLSVIDSRKQCATGPTVSSLGATVTGAGPLGSIYSVDIWLSVNSAAHLGSPPITVPGGAVVAGGGDLTLDASTLASAGMGQGCT